jgi:RHS repeat-associated protein
MKRIIYSTIISATLLVSHTSFSQPGGGGPAQRIYVKKGATGLGDGTSWTDAYPELQPALFEADTAAGNVEIWVARGEYKPTTDLDRTVSFNLPSETLVYGGFVGTETNLVDRDWKLNRTVLSGDLGILFDKSDNSYHVVKALDIGDQSGLDGFIIKEGNSETAALPGDLGGGMNILATSGVCSPKIANCTFIQNEANSFGGLAVVSNGGTASPEITNCKFYNNFSHNSGSGVGNYVFGGSGIASPLYFNCVFSLNKGEDDGAIRNQGSDATFINCTISGNIGGVGIAVMNLDSSPTIENSIIWGNLDNAMNASTLGQIYNQNSSPTVRNNIIQGGYGLPEDNNVDEDPLFINEPSSEGKFPRTSIIPVEFTDPRYENEVAFSGPKMTRFFTYYTFLDHTYNKLYMTGQDIQILDFNQLTNGLPTSTVYYDVRYGKIQRLENAIHYASNKIYFGSAYTGIVAIDRATGEKTIIDVLAGEGVSYTTGFGWRAEDVVVDNANNLLYASIFYYTANNYASLTYHGLLELDLTTNTKRWITPTSTPVSGPGYNTSGEGDYWNGYKLYLDESQNTLYYSTGSGVWWWNRSTDSTGTYSMQGGIPLQPGNPSIPSNLITHIFIDEQDNKFYIGTHEGLFVWDRNNNTSRVYNKDNSLMIDNLVDCIDKNVEKNLLYVACEYGGLFVIDLTTGEEKLYTDGAGSEVYPQLMDNDVSSANYDEVDKKLYASAWYPEGGVWIMDYNNLLPDYGDLRLQAGSPAIDQGDESAFPTSITTDIDGLERFVDYVTLNGENKLDIGAYEREYNAADDQPATEASQSPTTHNYILSYSPLEEMTDESLVDNGPVEQVSKSIQFFDGLGRPDQTIGIQASPNKRDMVQPIVYDQFSREAEKYLPYVSQGANGWFKSDPVGKESQNYLSSPQSWFYQSSSNVAIDNEPYAKTVFEPSPLNRILKQGLPGLSWQPDSDSTYASQDHTIKSAFEYSVANEVLLWTYTTPTSALPIGLVEASNGTTPIYNLANQLYKNKTRDEQGNEVIEFVDKQGRTVLKKVQAPNNEWAETYYIYDDFGNLVTVVPPEAVKQIRSQPSEYFGQSDTNKDSFLGRWAFRYTYDARKRMIQKQVPGAEPVFMVYDDRDRLAMTQDGNQRVSNQWTFTKYDALNRPVLTGIFDDPQARDLATMQADVNAFYTAAAGNSDEWFEVAGTEVLGYTNNSFPDVSSEDDYLTATYYDNYGFPGASTFPYDPNELAAKGQEPQSFSRITNQVTGTSVKNLDDDTWLLSVNYYDDRYRVIQTIMENQLGGTDRTTNVYDFPGRLLFTKTNHSDGVAVTEIEQRFEYDHASRLLKVWHKLNNGPEVLLSENEYNELGQLINKNLHSEDQGATFAQQVDYRYNIRGWLTRINNSNLDTSTDGGPADYFGIELAYDNPFAGISANPQFNGNISAMKWSTNLGLGEENTQFPELSHPSELAYNFEYDPMNRLESAAYNELTGTNWSTSSSNHEDDISYDLNGNIEHLRRTTDDGGVMDLMDYDYGAGTANHSNKLLSVTDSGDNQKGFVDGNTTGDDYDYDPNGNMTEDKNKGITTIEYNYLNLPLKVTKTSGEYIKYIYDATGRKLSQEVYDAGDVLQKKTNYDGEFIYENDTLKFINTEEGRVIPDANEYQYHLKDHLGNVRLTFTTKEDDEVNLATLETANADDEMAEFLYYDEAVKINSALFDHTHLVSSEGDPNGPPITGIEVTPSGTVTLKVGQTMTLTKMPIPSNGTYGNYGWYTTDLSVVAVDEDGVITAISPGTAGVTFYADGFGDGVQVNVVPSDNLINNFEFDQELSDWVVYDWGSGGGSTASVVQGAGMSGNNSAYVSIGNADNSGWKIQLRQGLDFALEYGHTYEITFIAKAEAPRTIKAVFQGSPSNTEYWNSGSISITQSAQTYGPYQFTCNNANVGNESSFSFKFYLAYGVLSNVWIDKVIVNDITQGGAVTDVLLTPETLSLVAGQTGQLGKTIIPTNASNQNVTWTSSDEGVATVNSTGLVTAVSSGNTTITITTDDGGYSATCEVTVKPVGTNLVQNNEFDDGFSGWGFSDWTSSGGNTATVVDDAGMSGGKALYVDIANADNSEWTISVNQPLEGQIEVGKTYEISFMAKAESTRDVKMAISGTPSNAAYWQKTVTVTTSPQLYGPYQFTCSNNGGESNFYTVFMLAKGVISDVWIDDIIINDISEGAGIVAGVSVSPSLTLTNGQTNQLAKTIMPTNAANQNVTWISSNTAVAIVDDQGVVSAVSPGAATITVITEDGGYTARSIVTVLPSGTNANQNEEFDDGLTSWVLYDWTGTNYSNGGNSLSVVQGAGLSGSNAAYVNVVNNNNEGWTLQLRQGLDFKLEVGRTYEISFMAKAESSRQIQAVIQGSPSNTSYWNTSVNATTTAQTFGPFQFNCTDANVANETSFGFKFWLAKGVISDVWIDKVIIRDLSGGGTNPVLSHIEAEDYDAQSGMYTSNGALNSCDAGDWAEFDNVDLTGAIEFRANTAAPGAHGEMEVRLGSTTGTLIATLPGINTGGWSTYKQFSVPLTQTTGTQNVFVVFKDWGSGVMNLDWIEFLSESPTVPLTGISISPQDPTVYLGQVERLSTSFTPSNATNKVVTWASSDTNIATVNANGDVTGLTEGTTTITVTTEDGAFTNQVTVTVAENPSGTFYSTRLSGSQTERYGLAKSLSVMPGDVVKMEVYAKYLDPENTNWTALLNNLIISLSVPSAGTFVDGGASGSLGNETLPFTPIDHSSEGDTPPKAYLNYILFNHDMTQVIDFGFQRITSAALESGQDVPHERLYFDDVTAKEPGYMYIYLSNENDTPVDVFFDDFKVEVVKSPIIQQDDYYPFGLTFNSYQRENVFPNRWKFQGQEHVKDLDLGWDSFKWRNHQPDIGRFFNVDPLTDKYVHNSPYAFSENRVVGHVELEGLEAVSARELTHQNLHPASWVRTTGFAIRHPIAARRIGTFVRGATNITTNAVRFSTRGNILNENDAREGTEVNAFRHTLWQATIANEFDAGVAKQAGNAHEQNPDPDLGRRTFETLEQAGETVDLLNNAIGREIAGQNPDAGMQKLSIDVLTVFAKEGLWTATQGEDRSWSIQRTTITKEQHEQLLAIFQNLNNNGRTKEEEDQARDEDVQRRLAADPR